MKRPVVVAVSGGFDPLHVGHVRYLLAARALGDRLVVIVNGDGFLMRKKGFVAMPLAERLEMLGAVRGVDAVLPWDDGSPTVTGALELLRPDVFAKGGDRNAPSNVPEFAACRRLGCRVEFGVGGFDKANGSRALAARIASGAKRAAAGYLRGAGA